MIIVSVTLLLPPVSEGTRYDSYFEQYLLDSYINLALAHSLNCFE